jgi:hypothetical protein
MSITPQTRNWLRQSAALDGAVVSQTLLNLLERVEALEQRPTSKQSLQVPPTPEAASVVVPASNFDSRLIALATTSEQIPPGPYSEHELQNQWNAQADEHNQWESLDLCEQLAWAQARAIAADRNGRGRSRQMMSCLISPAPLLTTGTPPTDFRWLGQEADR